METSAAIAQASLEASNTGIEEQRASESIAPNTSNTTIAVGHSHRKETKTLTSVGQESSSPESGTASEQQGISMHSTGRMPQAFQTTEERLQNESARTNSAVARIFQE